MGQEITAIITNQPLEIDKGIVHFKEGACVIIPININPYHLEHFIGQALKFSRIDELLDDLELKNGSDWNIEDYTDPEEEDGYGHSLKTLIDWIRTMGLQNFILEHYSDFASIPTDGYFVFIRGGEIVKESAMFRIDGLDADDYIPFLHEIGLYPPPYWFADEAKYQWYSNAEEMYRAQSQEQQIE